MEGVFNASTSRTWPNKARGKGERERNSAKGNSMFKWAEEYGSGVEVKAIQYGVQSKKRYERRHL